MIPTSDDAAAKGAAPWGPPAAFTREETMTHPRWPLTLLFACLWLSAPIASAERPAEPRADLLRLAVDTDPTREPPADEITALVLLEPGVDAVTLEIQAVEDSLGAAAATPAPAEGAAPLAAIPYMEGEGDAHRDADGRFRLTATASRPGGDAVVKVVMLVPHSALRFGPDQVSFRYTATGRVGEDEVFFASSSPLLAPRVRPAPPAPPVGPALVPAEVLEVPTPPPAPVEFAPAPMAPSKVTPPPPAPSKVAPAPQAPAKAAPAPRAPAGVVPAPMAPAGRGEEGGATGPPMAPATSPFISPKERTIHFATNRNVLAWEGSLPERFGEQLGDAVRYGSCVVNLPTEAREPGSLRTPRPGEAGDPRREFFIVDGGARLLDEAGFRALVRGTDTGRDVLVYVHGFNTSFDFAVVRLAQVVEDMRFAGLPVAFSWPSREVGWPGPDAYSRDELYADHSYGALARVFRTLAAEQAARPADRRGKIHVIAHSLGNRVTMRALSILDSELPPGARPMGQIVLAAPDVSTPEFARLQPLIARRADRVSLYYNPHDRALWASFAKHGRERRAGNSAQFLPGLDNIDAANVDTSLLGHGYWSDARVVLQDMRLLITKGWEPARRVPDILQEHDRPQLYWGFPAERWFGLISRPW